MQNLIDQGNQFFRKGDFHSAITQYTLALQQQQDQEPSSSSSSEALRALTNRAQCYISLSQHNHAIHDCLFVLNHYDRTHAKTLYRLIKSYESLHMNSMAIYFILLAEYYHPLSSEFAMLRRSLEASSMFMSLNHMIQSMTAICNHYVRSTHQLKNIEHERYHDTWQLEDYFDRENDFRKFDVPCPSNLFVKTEGLIERESQYMDELRAKIERDKGVVRDESEFDRLNQLTSIYTIESHVSNDVINSSSSGSNGLEQMGLALYYKYAQGTKRSNGFPNALFAMCLAQVLKTGRQIYMLTSAPETTQLPIYDKQLNPPVGAMKRVVSVGLKCGNVRCKSTTWYAIARGSVVVRDYDPHSWVCIKLANVDSDEVTDELNIDFMAAQFGYYSVHKQSRLPLRLFTNEMNQFEEQSSHEDLRAVYKPKRDRVFWDQQVIDYVITKYYDDYPISEESMPIFQPILSSLQRFMVDNNFLQPEHTNQ